MRHAVRWWWTTHTLLTMVHLLLLLRWLEVVEVRLVRFRKLYPDLRVVEEWVSTESSQRLFGALCVNEVHESDALSRERANEADRAERTHRRAKFLLCRAPTKWEHDVQNGTGRCLEDASLSSTAAAAAVVALSLRSS